MFGVLPVELVEPVLEHMASEIRSCRDPHLSPHDAFPSLEKGMAVVERLECLFAVDQICPTLIRESQMAGRALEQARMQYGFELEQARARGGGRQSELAARS